MTDYWNKDTLILGCGNILFGDDGFGPAVVEHFQKNYHIPDHVGVINAGLSVREILFTLALGEKRPQKIIIVDAVDVGRPPGEIFELDVSELPETKIDDFSMHQLPTSNLLRELKELCGVEVRIISTQVHHLPAEVCPGLSKVVADTIPAVCEKIREAVSPRIGEEA
ncbi:MAG: hydrogenase maturation protease [candidate division KSB1 bacterium]|nr:hydrogenase maturation protease [candidate division KSB1 bacterium]